MRGEEEEVGVGVKRKESGSRRRALRKGGRLVFGSLKTVLRRALSDV